MLDLELLEKQLDEALANETEESLEAWLSSKQDTYLDELMANGVIQTFESIRFNFNSLSEKLKPTVPEGEDQSNTSKVRLFKNAA